TASADLPPRPSPSPDVPPPPPPSSPTNRSEHAVRPRAAPPPLRRPRVGYPMPQALVRAAPGQLPPLVVGPPSPPLPVPPRRPRRAPPRSPLPLPAARASGGRGPADVPVARRPSPAASTPSRATRAPPGAVWYDRVPLPTPPTPAPPPVPSPPVRGADGPRHALPGAVPPRPPRVPRSASPDAARWRGRRT